MNTLNAIRPELGALLRCWFPLNETPNKIGPKFRPVFFFASKVVDRQLYYAVAYGTSKSEDLQVRRDGSDFIVTAESDGYSVLDQDTRFDFNNIKLVPATAEYFTSDERRGRFRMSSINPRYNEIVIEAATAARVKSKLASLGIKL